MPVMLLSADLGNQRDPELYPAFGNVLMTCAVGILIVFAVLAIIYLVMMIISRALANKGDRTIVTCPFDCTVGSLVAGPRANEDDVVATVVADGGEEREILAPQSGFITFKVKKGDRVKKGAQLFIIK